MFCNGIPIAVIMLGVKRGHWTDNHVRVREQRAVLLMATMASVLTGTSLLVVPGAPREVFALVVLRDHTSTQTVAGGLLGRVVAAVAFTAMR
ncbi:hypothetical protein GCM10010345_69780 [Streptomyces canarius]|uniref:Uncharacterized protein n=1 Tax=Streptomyces canarius TaxID=285453 RepID=A0ABQ3D574_9ACTN|nr:hypothetical protein GCM10010345_69780 [Streptomyces canarius]